MPNWSTSYSFAGCSVERDFSKERDITTTANNSVGSESILSQGDRRGTTSLVELSGTQEQFTGDFGCLDDISGNGRGHAITIRQNYAPWKEPAGETSNVGSEGNPCLEKINFSCLTQGCIKQGSTHLRLHRGNNETIGRWKFGSEIKYSIDYDSFLTKGRTKDDADYALKSLQVALEEWNRHNIGVMFKFVEPDTSPIVFQLEFEHEPLHIPFDIRSSVLASSFFPAHQAWDRKLYVFAASFDNSLRPHMTKIFLHESAHILGGRHENADTAEKDDPSVQLGTPNKQSVLVTNLLERDATVASFTFKSETYETRELPKNMWSLETASHARAWLHECLENSRHEHWRCEGEISPSLAKFLPPRLIRVTHDGKVLRATLQETKEFTNPSEVRYITVSHRWGVERFLTLTSENYASFKVAIPLYDSQFSKKFVVIFQIVVNLGYHYVWIDSLCIIQGDYGQKDWAEQCPLMAYIYRDADCNIAVARPISSGGLFGAKKNSVEVFPPKFKFPNGQWFRLVHENHFDNQIKLSPLFNRGWVVQERLLQYKRPYENYTDDSCCSYHSRRVDAEAMSAPEGSQGGMYVKKFFLEDKEAHIEIPPLEDKRVFIELASTLTNGRGLEVWYSCTLWAGIDSKHGSLWTFFWPDYILDHLPGARVILFNYDTELWCMPNLESIRTATTSLTYLLRKARKGGFKGRRMIWVAHGLGGFLVKAACIPSTDASNLNDTMVDQEVPDNLERATDGVVFMGTPHRALSVGGWPPILQRICEAAGKPSPAFRTIGNIDNMVIEETANFLSRFYSVINGHRMGIVSFYEQNETSGTSLPMLVTSCENGLFHPCETQETLPGNYLTMCQFQSHLDVGFKKLKDYLRAIHLHASTDNTPIDFPIFEPDISMVYAVKNAITSEPINEWENEEGETLLSPSIMKLYAPTCEFLLDKAIVVTVPNSNRLPVKLRLLKRFLAFPKQYLTGHPPTHVQFTQGDMRQILLCSEFDKWLKSGTLLVIREPIGPGKSTFAHQIIHALGVGPQREGGPDSPRKCVLSYFFINSPSYQSTFSEMLNQLLLQFLEIIPSLTRHFPTRQVFAGVKQNWPEWDVETLAKNEKGVEEYQLDTDSNALVPASLHRPSYADFVVSPFTTSELIEILISILHDSEVGDVFLVIDGLDDCSPKTKWDFQCFLNLMWSLRNRRVQVCLGCYTTLMNASTSTIGPDSWINEEPILTKHEDHKDDVEEMGKGKLDALISEMAPRLFQSHIILATSRQIVRGLSSPQDIASFTKYLQEFNPGTYDREPKKLDNLYEWVFRYLQDSASWKGIGLLFLVAVAARSLTTSEACDLAPLGEELAVQYLGLAEHEQTTLADNIPPLDGINTSQAAHALEAKFLGFLRVTDNVLTISHSTFKTFILQKLNQDNLKLSLHYRIGIHCLKLMQELKDVPEMARYGCESKRQKHSVSVQKFIYPLQHWPRHLEAAHSSKEWKSSQSDETLSLLTILMLTIPADVRELRSKGYLSQLLVLAIRRGSQYTAINLLMSGADCNSIDQDDPRKPSVLHIAAALGYVDLVRDLVYKGSRATITDAFGMQPVHWAAERGHHLIVNLLLSPLWKTYDGCFGRGLFVTSCESVSSPTFLVVLKSYKDHDFSDDRRRVPFHTAAATGSTAMIRFLLSKGANADWGDVKGITPIHLAAFGGWVEAVKELLSAGVFANSPTRVSQTPLHFACKSPNPSLAVVRTLLQYNANPYTKDEHDITALHIAVRRGLVAIVKTLLTVMRADDDIERLLVLARGNWELEQILRKWGPYNPFQPQPPVETRRLPDETGDALVNVMFVHGYFSSHEETWSGYEEYLPSSEARARVYFWDRRLKLTDFLSLDNVYQLGKLLLEYIITTIYSRVVVADSKPLVLVGHSLGGLVIKAAIAETAFSPLLAKIKGVVFLGTPHEGPYPHSLSEAVGTGLQEIVDDRLRTETCPDPTFEDVCLVKGWGKDVGEYNNLEVEFVKRCKAQNINVLSMLGGHSLMYTAASQPRRCDTISKSSTSCLQVIESPEMMHSILLFAYRKPGTTPEQFQAYYEEKHIKLIKELAGDDFPISHTRRYVHRTRGKGDTERNADYPATVFLGEQADFDYDCCSELIFSDSAALYAFKEILAQPENATRIAADEENFIDRSR
ncbi:hypothetical protein GQX73_g779 [Xylaria multiplex]|uniref:Uncharacterized protein n=1 Tax=Xylaria multiplex TaxID=323545 RepID=A0A7C8MYT7_9PEZI|nr:hypothetical protein GQX73_g779 [Xylaria multiplex]